jgi:hypothetical protein
MPIPGIEGTHTVKILKGLGDLMIGGLIYLEMKYLSS